MVVKSRTSTITQTMNLNRKKIMDQGIFYTFALTLFLAFLGPLQLMTIKTPYSSTSNTISLFHSLFFVTRSIFVSFSTWSLIQVSKGHNTFQVFSLETPT